MKRFWCLLLLPLIALTMLCGCGEDKKAEDLKTLYNNMKNVCVIEENNMFFSDNSKPNSIVIKYSDIVEDAINSDNAITNMQKRYNAIGLQQDILDFIFNYYENNQENFYRIMSSNNYDKKDMNNLYSSLDSLKSTLSEFSNSYKLFDSATSKNLSDVMEFNLTHYSFELNKVIDKSFAFIYNFIDVYTRYCVENYAINSASNLELRVEKSFVDIAYVVYLENFKSFDYSVGSKGICDLSSIVDSSNEFAIVDNLKKLSKLSDTISANLDSNSLNYDSALAIINKYMYSQEVFDQRIRNYINVYNSEDIYTLTQYKFNLVAGVTYDTYIKSLPASNKSVITILEDFVKLNFNDLVSKLKLVTA